MREEEKKAKLRKLQRATVVLADYNTESDPACQAYQQTLIEH